MKTLKRNKTKFYYALYAGKKRFVDENGNTTGEYIITYTSPIRAYANISPASGETTAQQFGRDIQYDKVAVMDSVVPGIDEYTVLWIDTMPQLSPDGTLAIDSTGKIITPYDYVVKKIAKSLNSISIAVKKVSVNG